MSKAYPWGRPALDNGKMLVRGFDDSQPNPIAGCVEEKDSEYHWSVGSDSGVSKTPEEAMGTVDRHLLQAGHELIGKVWE